MDQFSFPSVAKPNNKVIWLVSDDRSTPYEHHLNGECECYLCIQKPRLILAA